MNLRNACRVLQLVALSLLATFAIRADDAPPQPKHLDNPIQQIRSRINELRSEGKNEEADQLELNAGFATGRLLGAKPLTMPEIHLPAPTNSVPNLTLVNDAQPEPRPMPNRSSVPREQRVRALLAAAANLKAAGLEQDAARYSRMAAQLAQDGSSSEVAELRREVAELRGAVGQLLREVEQLKKPLQGESPRSSELFM